MIQDLVTFVRYSDSESDKCKETPAPTRQSGPTTDRVLFSTIRSAVGAPGGARDAAPDGDHLPRRHRELLNLNLDEVATAATKLGFNVTVAEAGADMPAFAALVNAEDVLLAVHGAGLTNQIFLPTQAVVLQIVPWWSMDRMTTNFYGQPARDMQLRYVEYYVDEQETSMTMATLNLQIQPLHYYCMQ
ncbi:hypothetical protein D1007_26772 [Hordeum vulgare]|nr:hypothetical protein D1007_26772 [Hordeum vulgare]